MFLNLFKRMRSQLSAVGYLLLLGIVPTFYNSCGSSPMHSKLSGDELSAIQTEAGKQYQGQLSKSFCEDSENYFCEEINVDKGVVRASSAPKSFECINNGEVELCIDGVRVQQPHPVEGGTESSQKYFCYNKLISVRGVFAIQASSSTFSEAVDQMYNSCVSMVTSNEGLE